MYIPTLPNNIPKSIFCVLSLLILYFPTPPIPWGSRHFLIDKYTQMYIRIYPNVYSVSYSNGPLGSPLRSEVWQAQQQRDAYLVNTWGNDVLFFNNDIPKCISLSLICALSIALLKQDENETSNNVTRSCSKSMATIDTRYQQYAPILQYRGLVPLL